jgi:biopolymer transport protein ExbD
MPRTVDDGETSDMLALVVTVAADLSITAEQAGTRQSMELADLPRFIRNRLDHQGNDKVVFIDFDDQVAWQFVVETMDQVRSAANDAHHDEIAVALVVKPGRN